MKLCGRLGSWLVARAPDLIAHTDRLAEHGYGRYTHAAHLHVESGYRVESSEVEIDPMAGLRVMNRHTPRVSLPERNSTSRGVCRFTDFSSACSECRFAVEIMTTDWTYQFVGYQMEFAYSRIEEYWYPKEEPFRCCPTRETFDCCNFYSDANQTFCDAWSCPESPNEDPWECTFPRVGTSGEDITWISIGSKNEVTRDLTLAGLGGLLILLALSWKYNRILRKVFWRIFGSCIRAVERRIKSVYARVSVSWFGMLLRRVKLLVILVWQCGGYDDEDAAEGSEDAMADQKGQANSGELRSARALPGEKSTEASNASGDVSPLVEPIERSVMHRLRDAAGKVLNGLGAPTAFGRRADDCSEPTEDLWGTFEYIPTRATPRLDRIARDAAHREELRQYESKLRLNRRMDESMKKGVIAVKAMYRKDPGMVLLGGPTTMAINSAISNLNGFSKWTTRKGKHQWNDHGRRSVRRDIEKRAKAWPKTPLLRWLEGDEGA
ncbi:hypothetical protein FOZ63_005468 [Perkinsus olseni]|uniref:Uncharacterized protein n=1 Tax=Perkinsus olseni TaxID=32597 RepID=A0A7J6TIN5_PEROL|nr:hypothetical protein FOZ63_005468 [Perkinsus olseni]